MFDQVKQHSKLWSQLGRFEEINTETSHTKQWKDGIEQY